MHTHSQAPSPFFPLLWMLMATTAAAEEPPAYTYPPEFPDRKAFVTDESSEFLQPACELQKGVVVARTPPVIDFLYYPGQDYPGRPWSVWGDGSCVGEKFYSSIGDHLSPRGSPRIFEYDPATRTLRMLADLKKVLESSGALVSETSYTPGKVHGRIDAGSDGWLYYSSHRGSPTTSTDEHGFQGDWIFRTHPGTGRTEIVAAAPVPKHCIPCSVLDPQRLVFYGGTAAGRDALSQGVMFFAYDLRRRKLLYSGAGGPARYMFLAPSTGRVYFGPTDEGPVTRLMRYHPEEDAAPVPVGGEIGLRAATQETRSGFVYTVSRDDTGTLWSFDTKSEKIERLGPAAVAKQSYITSLDVDPSGRYLYYVAGAHGGGAEEGTPVVQFDLQTRTRKVLAFLHPFHRKNYGYTPDGSFSSAHDAKGEKLYITWNGTRSPKPEGSRTWESCALTVIHVPAAERP